jgi:hypothetical protein
MILDGGRNLQTVVLADEAAFECVFGASAVVHASSLNVDVDEAKDVDV